MNRFRPLAVTVVTCSLLLSAHRESRADNYALDMSHTAIIFGISHMNYSYTYGRFNKAQGRFAWNNANPAASQFMIAIETASIDTNDAQRDGHLRNADFFNANQFPQIVFQSTSVTPSRQNPGSNMYDVVGNLTIHGVTKQVVLPMKKLGEGPGPYGKYRTGFFCQTTLKRSDFGMTNMLPNIGDQVAITLSFEGTREGAGSGSAPAGSGSATNAGSAPKGSGSAPKGSGSAPKGSGSAPKGSSGTR